MGVWIVLVFFLILLRLLMGTLDSKKKQKLYLIFSGIAVAFVMGCRFPKYDIVYDLSNYYNYYKELYLISWSHIFEYSRFEYGYALMNKILVTIIPWPQFIVLFEATFSVFAVSRFLYKYSEFPFWGMLFYVTLGTMTFQLTAFRQAFAICICLFSIDFIKQKKPIKFLLTVLIAAAFHIAAIAFIPFYFFANRKHNLKNNLFSILTMIIMVYSANWITNIGNEVFNTEYRGYAGNIFGGLIPIAIYILTILLSWKYYIKVPKRIEKLQPRCFVFNKDKPKDKPIHKSEDISVNMLEIGLGIYLMRYVTLALERVSFFYTPGLIIALPDVLHRGKDPHYQLLIKIIALILAVALFGYRLTTSEWANYRFFWE